MFSGKKQNKTLNGHSTFYGSNAMNAVTFNLGGNMEQLTHFNEGGSHEENPLGGIPQGMNSKGGMNLVEEKETKLNAANYIFSESLKIDSDTLNSFNLPARYAGKSFAEISKALEKPKSRRENDSIEQNAIKKDLSALMAAQEDFKQKEVQKKLMEIQSINPNFLGSLMQQGQVTQQEQASAMPEGMPADPTESMPSAEMPEEQDPQGFKFGGGMNNTIYSTAGELDNVDPETAAKIKAEEDAHNAKLQNYGQYAQGIGNMAQGMSSAFRGNNVTNDAQTDKGNAAYETTKAGVSQAGPWGAIIGGAMNLGDAIGTPIKNKLEKTDSQGNLTNKQGVETGFVMGTLFNPLKTLTHGLSTGEWSAKQYRRGAEKRAKINLMGENWAHPTTDAEGIVQDPNYNPITGLSMPNNGAKYGGFFALGGDLDLEGDPIGTKKPVATPVVPQGSTPTQPVQVTIPKKVNPPASTAPTLAQINSWKKQDSTAGNQHVNLNNAVLITDPAKIAAHEKEFKPSPGQRYIPGVTRLWETKDPKTGESFYVMAEDPQARSAYNQKIAAQQAAARQAKVVPSVPPTQATVVTQQTTAPVVPPVPRQTAPKGWQGFKGNADYMGLEGMDYGQYQQVLALPDNLEMEFRKARNANTVTTLDEWLKQQNINPAQFTNSVQPVMQKLGGFLNNQTFALGGPFEEEDSYLNPQTKEGKPAAQSAPMYRPINSSEEDFQNAIGNVDYVPNEFMTSRRAIPITRTQEELDIDDLENDGEPDGDTDSKSELDRKPGETEEEYRSRLQRMFTEQTDNNKDLRVKETGLNFAGKYAPVAYNLGRGLFEKSAKRHAKDYFENIDVAKLDITDQLRAADEAYAGANNAIKDIAPGAGSYLANRIASAGQEAKTKGALHTQKKNYDNNMLMEVNKYNTAGRTNAKLSADDFNMRAKAAKEAFTQQGLSQLNQIATSNEQNKLGMSYAELMAPDFTGRAGYVSTLDNFREAWKKNQEEKKKKNK